MSDIDRPTLAAIAGKVGCDPRTVQRVIAGEKLRTPALARLITAELKRRGIETAKPAPPAAEATAPASDPPSAAEG